MNKPNPSLTKTCSSCGIQKPLSAFLQLTDKNGTTYGNICSTCRHANKENAPTEKEGSTRSDTELTLTIDAKARAQYEIDHVQHHQQEEDEYSEEREKQESLEINRIEKKEQLVKSEKKIRETLLGKRSFLSSDKKTDAQKIAEKKFLLQAQGIEQTNKLEAAAKEEQKEKDIDFTAPVEDTRFGKKEKHKGIAFQHFTYVQSPIGKAFSPKEEQSATFSTPEPSPETPSEYIEKTWGPGSKRR